MNFKLSPIVLFTYNRPLHTVQVLNSLAENIEAKDSVLYVFCDGAKENVTKDDLKKINEVKNIVRKENRFKSIIITINELNKGLANSIIDGVTSIINIHGKVIVLEDDLILSPFFLSYMNDSLNRYENDFSVGQIGACNFFACGKNYPDYFFVPLPDCLGWATWKDRWDSFNPNVKELTIELINNKDKIDIFNAYGAQDFMDMLDQQKQGKVNSWAIRWQAVCVLNGWLTLYPNPAMSNHKESEEATHANKNIAPPITIIQPKFHTVEVKEVYNVIKAFKLGYSGKGDYFGKRKKKSKKKIIKKIIKMLLPRFFIIIWKKIRK